MKICSVADSFTSLLSSVDAILWKNPKFRNSYVCSDGDYLFFEKSGFYFECCFGGAKKKLEREEGVEQVKAYFRRLFDNECISIFGEKFSENVNIRSLCKSFFRKIPRTGSINGAALERLCHDYDKNYSNKMLGFPLIMNSNIGVR
ncbi:MAG: hypothetical protein GY750_06690 [Lentisphaerae bacterium]|nr:hypothetical protein [Lentisphaerota bacterium]MCP4101096.1 hypothetical protein [Lentisphaerota bacterium]